MIENFVKTSSEELYKKLIAYGATYLGREGDLYCFINDQNIIQFNEDDKKKILYTNMICLQES